MDKAMIILEDRVNAWKSALATASDASTDSGSSSTRHASPACPSGPRWALSRISSRVTETVLLLEGLIARLGQEEDIGEAIAVTHCRGFLSEDVLSLSLTVDMASVCMPPPRWRTPLADLRIFLCHDFRLESLATTSSDSSVSSPKSESSSASALIKGLVPTACPLQCLSCEFLVVLKIGISRVMWTWYLFFDLFMFFEHSNMWLSHYSS